LQGLRQNWDAVNNTWNQWVLDYTPARQKSFMQSLGFDDADWSTLTALMFGLGAVVMALVALPLIRNRQKPDPVDALYFSLCRQLARRGCAREPYEGPRAYGIRLREAALLLSPRQIAAAARFLELYESLRYGPPDAGDTARKKPAAAVLKQLKTFLAQSR
jgi:hypothetical protein